MTEPNRIAVFGGTFNPPHVGHRACLEIALAEFGDLFDTVLVVPTNLQYYKDRAQASPGDRLEMCRLAFGSVPGVAVSDLDITRGGVTYTADTLRDVRRLYGNDARIYFILGSDSFAWVSGWRDAEKLQAEAEFLVIPRGEVPVGDVPGFTYRVAGRPAPVVSSSQIRDLLTRGESVANLLEPSVLWYISKRNLYGSAEHMTNAERVFSSEFMDARKADLQARVGAHRYAHIMGVADTARSLACTYEVDPDKAYLAGLLHDWDKNFDDEGIRARADSLGLSVPEEVYWGSPQTLHGLTAAAALGKEYPDIPADVLQAVSRHTTGALGMTPLDMVVYIADALEPGRNFPGLENLRARVGKESLEDLFISVHAYWISLIVGRKKTLHPDTIAVWNYYASRHRDKKGPVTDPDKPGDWSRRPEDSGTDPVIILPECKEE